MTDRIEGFNGEYRFLSNFYPALTPVELSASRVEIAGIKVYWQTAEHAYQMMKFIGTKNELEAFRLISSTDSPAAAKKAGRVFAPRPDWDRFKLHEMKKIVRSKFTYNSRLGDELKATGEKVLVETNDWNDTYWGMCDGKGENHLGKILMSIRAELR